jgi:hypothetical protein
MSNNNTPRLRVVRRAVEELSDGQIERLIDFGRREADLIAQMEEATRNGNRSLVWQLAEALVRFQDEAKQVTEAGKK